MKEHFGSPDVWLTCLCFLSIDGVVIVIVVVDGVILSGGKLAHGGCGGGGGGDVYGRGTSCSSSNNSHGRRRDRDWRVAVQYKAACLVVHNLKYSIASNWVVIAAGG